MIEEENRNTEKPDEYSPKACPSTEKRHLGRLGLIGVLSVLGICLAFWGAAILEKGEYGQTNSFKFKRCKDSIEITECLSESEIITIPERIENLPVTRIGEWAFAKWQRWEQITIPEGITKIGDGAFSGCEDLTSVTEIGMFAFYGCTGLTDVTIPESVTEIGVDAFFWRPNLTLHAPAGSAAEKYAKENGIPFEPLE